MSNITISDLAPVETEFVELSAREVASVVGGYYYSPYYYGYGYGYSYVSTSYDYDYSSTYQAVSLDNYGVIGTVAIIAS